MNKNFVKSFFTKIREVFEIDKVLENYNDSRNLKSKSTLQLIVAISFFILSIANIVTKSYIMLILTLTGFVLNTLFALLAYKLKKSKISAHSTIFTCSVLFASFVIGGGNEGFACLWVILLPLMAMIIMDFKFGLGASLFFQLFLIVVFWTPLKHKLFYSYNTQFCLRFPLFFLVTFLLGLLLTVSLRHAEYSNYKHLAEMEELNKKTLLLSRVDPLTKLANRRFSYEEFENRFSENGKPHCVVMGDVDNFKQINDRCGHEFGDDVLIAISKCIAETLPESYLKSRWGGEEFLFAANESSQVVYEHVELVRKKISELCFTFNGSPINVTMTFGIADYDKKENIVKAITLADKRLYTGKSISKNCTIFN